MFSFYDGAEFKTSVLLPKTFFIWEKSCRVETVVEKVHL